MRAALEPLLGFDFAKVRVHSDAASAELAGEVRASAFTLGNHVFFAPGQYAPYGRSGRHLLAHELTHVVQQQGAASAVPQGTLLQRAPAQPNSGQTEVSATVPTPNRPTSAPPSRWTDADFEAYLRWALELQQPPPAATGITSGWKSLEAGRSAGYMPGSNAPAAETGLIFSSGKSREFASSEPGIGSGDTTQRARTGAGTRTEEAWVDLPAYGPAADLVVKAHSHTTASPAKAS